MHKLKIAVTGLSGFLGRSILKRLTETFDVVDLYNQHPAGGSVVEHSHLDLLNSKKITSVLNNIRPDAILHLAAATHIDRCEVDRQLGSSGMVWKTNVDATQRLSDYAGEHNVQLVFMSTECVFDGENTSFSETDLPNPKNWYGVTKYAAEKFVLQHDAAAVVRAVIAYNHSTQPQSIYGQIYQQLSTGNVAKAVVDQTISPTHTDYISKALITILSHQLAGVFHLAPSDTISPFEFALLIAQAHNFDVKLVRPTTLEEMFGSERSKLRLRHAVLDGKKSRDQLHLSGLTTAECIGIIR